MANNEPRLHLICYDIADPRRLGRVHRYLRDRAVPVQYSVFMAELTRGQLDVIIEELKARINCHHDDVRIYPLPRAPRIIGLGQSYFPEGIMLVSCGRDMAEPVVMVAA